MGEYKKAISDFEDLVRGNQGNAPYRQSLANCFNWLGETGSAEIWAWMPRMLIRTRSAYRGIWSATVPENAQYRRELARTRYNRYLLGLLALCWRVTKADFRRQFTCSPLAEKDPRCLAAQELVRVYNNLGMLFVKAEKLPEAREFYEHAIQIDEELVKSDPSNREYKQELATFNNNMAILLMEQQHFDLADGANAALDFGDDLATFRHLGGTRKRWARRTSGCQTPNRAAPRRSLCHAAFDPVIRLAKARCGTKAKFKNSFAIWIWEFLQSSPVRPGWPADQAQSSLDSLNRLLPGIPEPDRTA